MPTVIFGMTSVGDYLAHALYDPFVYVWLGLLILNQRKADRHRYGSPFQIRSPMRLRSASFSSGRPRPPMIVYTTSVGLLPR